MDHSYRRTVPVSGHVWHFCKHCKAWPRDHYVAQQEPPADGDFCHECAARHAIGACACLRERLQVAGHGPQPARAVAAGASRAR